MIDFFESPLGLWIRVVFFFMLSLYLLRSGIQPDTTEPRKWYDRALRIIGGVIFGVGALFGSARIVGWVY
jgi:peptidoglycan/LPS O-acetylase OafA/YrhL